jgi:hypothetical protein
LIQIKELKELDGEPEGTGAKRSFKGRVASWAALDADAVTQ